VLSIIVQLVMVLPSGVLGPLSPENTRHASGGSFVCCCSV